MKDTGGGNGGKRPEDRLDARQVRSRKALNAALLSLLEEKPFDQVTIREIAARANTGYATFFRHFPSKEALLEDVASVQIAQLIDLTLPLLSPQDNGEMTRALCAFVEDHRALWQALLTGGASGIVREQFVRQVLEVEGELDISKAGLPADLVKTCITGGVLDVLGWWLGREPERSSEGVAEILDRLVLVPVFGKGAMSLA